MNFSYWEQQSFFRYDALVIGSGIVGLSAAYYLKIKYPDWKIAVLERGMLPSGASTRNAGFACFGSISELIEQEKAAGTDGLLHLIERRWKGLLRLRELLGDQTIGFRNLGGYELFDNDSAVLEKECREKIRYYNLLIQSIVSQQEVFSVNNRKINTFGFQNVHALIENKLEGQIDTGKMMFALMQKALMTGVLLFNNCTVNRVEPVPQENRVYCTFGNIQARHLLLATNAFTKSLVPELDVVPGRGQVLITEPIPDLKPKGTFHYDKGFYYFRNIHDRILIGGGRNLAFEEEATTQFGLTDTIQQRLEQLLREIILPGIPFCIAQRWSGIMAFGKEITPIIQQLQPGIYCAVRGSGMGIAMGAQTGYDLAKMVG
ncbi:MAG TPA: FAD-dependent oxidoreductase [Edaphocola sp.]|nr:FAD-dependent oxidoreductase [Edaphocola sp.]